MVRIAVLNKKKCRAPKDCNYICRRFCPRVRAGDECVVAGEDGKAVIIEELCVGCNICVKKCPFEAISIVNLPDELDKTITHRYSKNGFRLYRLPIPKKGMVIGLLGTNGIGKSTAIKILSDEFRPNLGDFEKKEVSVKKIMNYFKGTETQAYFEKLYDEYVQTEDSFTGKVIYGNSEQLATQALYDAEQDILELESLGFSATYAKDLYLEAQRAFEGESLESVLIRAKVAQRIDPVKADELFALAEEIESGNDLASVDYNKVISLSSIVHTHKVDSLRTLNELHDAKQVIQLSEESGNNVTAAWQVYASAERALYSGRLEEVEEILFFCHEFCCDQ